MPGAGSRPSARVVDVRAIPFRIPLGHEATFSGGSYDARHHVLLTITTDAGVTGIAEAVPREGVYGETQASVVAIVEQAIAPALIGHELHARSGWRARLPRLVGNNAALAAVDTALWDAAGRSLGVPVWRLLGGSGGPVRVAAVILFGDAAAAARQAEEWRSRFGVTAFKIKVGRDPATDATVCAAIRQAVGADAFLYADANQAYSVEAALRFVRLAEPSELAWLEEPCRTTDALGKRRLAALSALPLAGDEGCRDLDECRVAILEHGCRVVSVKVARTGISGSVKVLALCEALHATATLGSQGDTALGAVAGLHLASGAATQITTPAELVSFLGLTGDLVASPPRLIDGCFRPPAGPGLGVEVDASALDHFRIDR